MAKLEEMGKLKSVVTQNIDDLHQKGGSKRVLELHGTLYRNYCLKCGKEFDLGYVTKDEGITRCDKCGGIVRPDVVLYEEGLDEHTIEEAVHDISHAQMLIVGGTSLNVYPAAGLLHYFRASIWYSSISLPLAWIKKRIWYIAENIGEVFRKVVLAES